MHHLLMYDERSHNYSFSRYSQDPNSIAEKDLPRMLSVPFHRAYNRNDYPHGWARICA